MKISTKLFDTAKFAGAVACSLTFFAAYAYFYSAPIGTPMPGDPVNPNEAEIQNFMNVSKSICGRLAGPSGEALDVYDHCKPIPDKDVRQYAEGQVKINERVKADMARLMGSDEEIAARNERAEKCRDDPDVYRGQFAHDCRTAYVDEQESSLSDDDAKRLSDQCSENPSTVAGDLTRYCKTVYVIACTDSIKLHPILNLGTKTIEEAASDCLKNRRFW